MTNKRAEMNGFLIIIKATKRNKYSIISSAGFPSRISIVFSMAKDEQVIQAEQCFPTER